MHCLTSLAGHNISVDNNRLVGRAVLDAATFSPGPTSGTQLGGAPINGQPVPFLDKQPVQGFSAVLENDARGRVLEPPIPLPDFDSPSGQREIRSPQNPFNEESSAVRIMNAVRKHARSQRNHKTPVFSPWHVMLDDANPDTFVDNRKEPPAGSGLKPASSEIFNVGSIQRAGYPVVVWTVNDKPRMLELMRLGVNGIISDRPDLLRQAVEEFDANRDGTRLGKLTTES